MKPKVIILIHQIQHYRIPIYNLVAKHFELTVASEKKISYQGEEPQFNIISIPTRRIGPFILHRSNIFSLVKKFDVVIGLQNLRCVDLMLLSLMSWRKFRLIYWGIGVSASYSKNFDTNRRWDFLRFFTSKKSDATIFYTSYPVERYVQNGVAREKIFIAHNTAKISEICSDMAIKKDSILFVGTLYREKGISELLDAYYLVYQKISIRLLKLVIVGDGPEMSYLKKYIVDNQLQNNIIIVGAMYNQEIIKSYYLSAFACISPNQAGLSVLTSMGYGVPFITKKHAITGGEILNINNGINGVIYNNSEELPMLLEDISLNSRKYITMGLNAAKYYNENRQPEMMANGIINAINYTLK